MFVCIVTHRVKFGAKEPVSSSAKVFGDRGTADSQRERERERER